MTSNSVGRYAYFAISGMKNGKTITTTDTSPSTPRTTPRTSPSSGSSSAAGTRPPPTPSNGGRRPPAGGPAPGRPWAARPHTAPAPRRPYRRAAAATRQPGQRPLVARVAAARGELLVRRIADLLQGQPVRGARRSRRSPARGRPAPRRASPPAGARPRPGSSRRPAPAPCCGRRRRPAPSPTDHPVGACAPSAASSSVRMVVAPSRFLQYAAKSCSPSSRPAAAFIGVHVQRPVVPQHVAAQQRVDAAGVVADPVGVPAPDRREPRVEARRRLGDADTRTSCGSRPASRAAASPVSAAQTLLPADPRAPPGRGRAPRRRCARPRSARTSGPAAAAPSASAASSSPCTVRRARLRPTRRTRSRRTPGPAAPVRDRAPPRRSRDRSRILVASPRQRARPRRGAGPPDGVADALRRPWTPRSSASSRLSGVLDGLGGLVGLGRLGPSRRCPP